MWTYPPRGPFTSTAAYREWAEGAAGIDDPLTHAIIDNASGEAVGTAAYMRIDAAFGVIEVGSITYSPRLQRRPAGTEAMYLMMRRVFDELGYRRYEWKCNSLNMPSRAAALRLGFQYEGALPPGDADARAQPRHNVVLGDRPRLAGAARRVRALARPGEFRRTRAPAAKPRELAVIRVTLIPHCHCEEQRGEAISGRRTAGITLGTEIASLRSQ
jgi:RimJ/RimL family protein N-acetyltransferase